MVPDLIFDIGLHTGEDTEYYLHKGFRVVAVEANPLLAEQCRRRFAASIQQGRVQILNVGIAPVTGTFPFWRHTLHSEWSSFIKNPNWKTGEYESLDVQCVRFADVLSKYGVPYYLKIDIEGADGLCLQDLQRLDLPKYVSFEGNPFAVGNLCLLGGLGYNAFKLVDQTTHNNPDPYYTNESLSQRLRRDIATKKWELTQQFGLDNSGLGKVWRLARSLYDAPRISEASNAGSSSKWVFETGSSGPFGEDTPGAWQSRDAILYNWLHRQFRYHKRGTLKRFGEAWYDFHCCRRPERDKATPEHFSYRDSSE